MQRARGQHEGQRAQRVVAVLLHPAAHPAAVVGQDPPDGAGADAGRVRTQLGPQGAEQRIEVVADHPRLGADPLSPLLHPGLAPVAGDLHQEPVGQRLPGEAGARGAKGQRDSPGSTQTKELLDLLDGPGEHHRLRNQAVAAGVGGEGDPIDGAGENPVGRHHRLELRDELRVRRGDVDRSGGHGAQPTRNTVAERAPCAPMTSASSMSAVFDGPEMKRPNPGPSKRSRR